jgi:hypothetical protein
MEESDSYLCLFLRNSTAYSLERDLEIINIDPDALRREGKGGNLPLHVECQHQRRVQVISRCLELYPESITVPNHAGNLPLHLFLKRGALMDVDLAFMIINKYPAALKLWNMDGNLPLHIEIKSKCRSPIISECIELYPDSLSFVDQEGFMPLHWLLSRESSSTVDAMMIIEKHPAVLQHQGNIGLPYISNAAINADHS